MMDETQPVVGMSPDAIVGGAVEDGPPPHEHPFLLFIILSFILSSFFILVMATTILSQNAYQVYFNEIRAIDQGSEDIEFIELIGPAGTSLQNFQIVHYNGSMGQDGGIWTTTIGNFTIPNECIFKCMEWDCIMSWFMFLRTFFT